jgi:hypothetical protein
MNPKNMRLGGAVLGLASLATAAPITWEGAFDTTGDAALDVRTNGALVAAVNFGPTNVPATTLNGVTFTVATNSVLTVTSAGMLTNAVSVLPLAYSNVLGTVVFGGGMTNSIVIASGRLLPGRTYLIQAWFADNRALANRNHLGMRLSGEAATNFVTLASGFEGPSFGQYAVGTFVADGVSQTLYLRTADGLASPQMANLHLNAYQIRQLDGDPPVLPAWRSFHIGNSLTQHSYPDGIELMLAQRGFSNAWVGYHINCGSSLINTWNNPTQSGCPGGPVLDPAAGFSVALTNSDWAALAVQPFKPLASSSTLGSDRLAITQMVATLRRRPQNQNSPVYLYATHHMTNDSINKSFPATWTQAVVDADETTTIQARAYFDLLHSRLDPLLEQPTREIPLGEVLYHFDLRARAGQIPGYTNAYQLYTDHVHLNNLGAYISGCTTFATLTGQDPWGTTKPAGFYGAGFPGDVFAAVQDLIWDVIEANPRARPIWHSDLWPEGVRAITHFGDAVVRTNGIRVQALNLGSASNRTVNGVLFEGRTSYAGLTNSVVHTNLYTNGVVSAEFESMLDSISMAHGYVSNMPHSATITLTGLVAGARHEVQLLVSEMRSTAGATRRQRFYLRGRAPFPVVSGMAYSLVASFTATGATETLSIFAELGVGETFGGVPTLNAFQVRRLADYDQDGMEDVWELNQTVGVSTNGVGDLALLSDAPGADYDGDGMSDVEEYRAGTSAVDGQSVFRLASIQAQTGGLWQVQWQAVPSNGAGRPLLYEVLSVSLTGAPIFDVLAVYTTGAPELVTLSVSNDAASSIFAGRVQEP